MHNNEQQADTRTCGELWLTTCQNVSHQPAHKGAKCPTDAPLLPCTASKTSMYQQDSSQKHIYRARKSQDSTPEQLRAHFKDTSMDRKPTARRQTWQLHRAARHVPKATEVAQATVTPLYAAARSAASCRCAASILAFQACAASKSLACTRAAEQAAAYPLPGTDHAWRGHVEGGSPVMTAALPEKP